MGRWVLHFNSRSRVVSLWFHDYNDWGVCVYQRYRHEWGRRTVLTRRRDNWKVTTDFSLRLQHSLWMTDDKVRPTKLARSCSSQSPFYLHRHRVSLITFNCKVVGIKGCVWLIHYSRLWKHEKTSLWKASSFCTSIHETSALSSWMQSLRACEEEGHQLIGFFTKGFSCHATRLHVGLDSHLQVLSLEQSFPRISHRGNDYVY